jgi:hypothetical protein
MSKFTRRYYLGAAFLDFISFAADNKKFF